MAPPPESNGTQPDAHAGFTKRPFWRVTELSVSVQPDDTTKNLPFFNTSSTAPFPLMVTPAFQLIAISSE